MAAEIKHVGVLQTHKGGCVYIRANSEAEQKRAIDQMQFERTYFAAASLRNGPRIDGCYEIFATHTRAGMSRRNRLSYDGYSCLAANNTDEPLSRALALP